MTAELQPPDADEQLDLQMKAELSRHVGAHVDFRTRLVIRRMARKAVRDNPEASVNELRAIVESEFTEYAERGGERTPQGDFCNDECAVPWTIIIQLIFLAIRFWIHWRRK